MQKLAVIDLDGVISDSSARFGKAEEAKAAILADRGILAKVDASLRGVKQDIVKQATEKKNSGLVFWSDEVYQKEDMQEADKAYWQTAFTPELIWLDTLIDGTKQVLEQINNYAGYDYYFLTSRPESMREETMKWLFDHLAFDSDASLIMKPASQQFVKTVTWKSGVVELLVRLFGVESLLFVDDEQAHCDMVEALDLPCDRIICGNLQEAMASIREEE